MFFLFWFAIQETDHDTFLEYGEDTNLLKQTIGAVFSDVSDIFLHDVGAHVSVEYVFIYDNGTYKFCRQNLENLGWQLASIGSLEFIKRC
jgi:hypothetical protein